MPRVSSAVTAYETFHDVSSQFACNLLPTLLKDTPSPQQRNMSAPPSQYTIQHQQDSQCQHAARKPFNAQAIPSSRAQG